MGFLLLLHLVLEIHLLMLLLLELCLKCDRCSRSCLGTTAVMYASDNEMLCNSNKQQLLQMTSLFGIVVGSFWVFLQ